MKILGLPIPFTGEKKALNSVDQQGRGGGWVRIFESYAGAWQHNDEINLNTVMSNPADFACKTLIASDISKLRVKLVQRSKDGIWLEVDNRNYQVLVKPNHFQTRIQFFESWALSKLNKGNTVVLKQRDRTGGVVGMYVLDWSLVRPLIADNGDVFYELNADKLSGVEQTVVVPAREIIHDRFNTLFHPLIGVSPIFAAGLAATHGLAILQQATKFFQNGSRPGGILTAPGAIGDDTAARLKEAWQTNYTGENAGKVAVLGDGLKYEAMATASKDAQLIEQLKFTAEMVCSVYHVPSYKIGLGQMPTAGNVESLNIEYYSQCLQSLLESIELLLDEGLGLRGELGSGLNLGTEFDIDNLLRMDTVSQLNALDKARSVMTLDERRRKLNLGPMPVGGATVYLQQQDHSIEAIAARDQQLIDGTLEPGPLPAVAPTPEEQARAIADAVRASLAGSLDDIAKKVSEPVVATMSDDEKADAAKVHMYAAFKDLEPLLMLPKPNAGAAAP